MKMHFWIYGLITGAMLVVLQIIHYKALVRELRMEIFGLLIGGAFLVFGIWLGRQVVSKQKQRLHLKSDGQSVLSEREVEVLGLMADGLSNQEIADTIFVSLNTVKTHISNIYLKMHVKRRTQAVQKAKALNLIVVKEVTA